MKNLKSIVKTFLFSALCAIAILTTDHIVTLDKSVTESSVSTCCEEYPDLSANDSMH